MARQLLLPTLLLAASPWAGGCVHAPAAFAPPPGAMISAEPLGFENPLVVPVSDHAFVWDQIVDTLDDHFKIAAEDRVRLVGGVLTEGRIETFPVIGATLLEPWRGDAASQFERLHNTLQSIRRYAEVRVVPVAAGYSIEVMVFKELEDVDRPEHATVGSSTLRHDGSLVRTDPTPESAPLTLGWIPQGRDLALEQQILAELQGRLAVHAQQP